MPEQNSTIQTKQDIKKTKESSTSDSMDKEWRKLSNRMQIKLNISLETEPKE